MDIHAADSRPATPAAPVPDAHKLAVYHVAVAFHAAASALIPKGHTILRDQLERASLSVVLNIAEGAGRRSRRDKGRFYTIARGSAMESAALIDVLVARQITAGDDAKEARDLAIRVIQMLTKLQQAMGRVTPSRAGRLTMLPRLHS